jgi:tRNA-specific 2-thiouridylase
MAGKTKKVFVAISGGVDSSTSAALLLEAGYECAGIFMITNGWAHRAQAEAEELAKRLGIQLHVLDLRAEFERVLGYFCSEYGKGRTPNPCVFCNRYIKFGTLWDFARESGGDFLATGHYARIVQHNNGAELYEAVDVGKDQSYVLSMVKKDTLTYVILPLGEHSKKHTRKLSAKLRLGTEQRQESQEICFIPENNYAEVLERRCPELIRRGKIVDSSGRILGEHNGVHRFTIGQRRGLRVAMGKPYYVVRIDAESNTVTMGPKEEVKHRKLLANGVNWLIDKPQAAFGARVRIRYNDPGAPAKVVPQADSAVVEFDEPNVAITPGQLAVFYIQQEDGNRVAGGGWIEEAFD